MKAQKYLGVEKSHNIEHKKEKDRLKKEYIRRLRLILTTELSAKKIKCKQFDHWQYQYYHTALELLTGIKRKYKSWTER
jgi:hypothetical protein